MANGFLEGFNIGSSIAQRRYEQELETQRLGMQRELHQLRMKGALRQDRREERDDAYDEGEINAAKDPGAALSAATSMGGPSAPSAAAPAQPGMPSMGAPTPGGHPMAPSTPGQPPQPGQGVPPIQIDYGAQLGGATAKRAPWVGDALQRQADYAAAQGRTKRVMELHEQLDRIKKSGYEPMFDHVLDGGDDAGAGKILDDHGMSGAQVRVLSRSTINNPGYAPINTADIEVTRNGKTEVIRNIGAVRAGINEKRLELAQHGYDAGVQEKRDTREQGRLDLANSREDRVANAQIQSLRLQGAAAARTADNVKFNQNIEREKLDFEKGKYADYLKGIGGGTGAASGEGASGTGAPSIDPKVLNDANTWFAKQSEALIPTPMTGNPKDEQVAINNRMELSALSEQVLRANIAARNPMSHQEALRVAYGIKNGQIEVEDKPDDKGNLVRVAVVDGMRIPVGRMRPNNSPTVANAVARGKDPNAGSSGPVASFTQPQQGAQLAKAAPRSGPVQPQGRTFAQEIANARAAAAANPSFDGMPPAARRAARADAARAAERDAEAGVQQQFEADRKTMDPVTLARKWYTSRDLLTRDQRVLVNQAANATQPQQPQGTRYGAVTTYPIR